MSEAILTDLVAALDIVAMERVENGLLRIIGRPSDWFEHYFPGIVTDQGIIGALTEIPFLDHFLTDADIFWQQRGAGQLRSGPWTEEDQLGVECPLEAVAICLGDRDILYVQRLGIGYQETRLLLQRARENRLDYERLVQAQEALRRSEVRNKALLDQLDKSHADLLSILDRVRVGTVLLDENERIAFINQVCQRTAGKEQTQIIGRQWTEVWPFPEPTRTQLQAMMRRPIQERTRISTHLKSVGGQYYWMEIDVQDDPRDARRKIMFFYDLSEVQDLRRVLKDRTRCQSIVGRSEPMLRIYREINDLAEVNTTVLIEGETGTGKELVAREIHGGSPRREKPFVALNCAGLTESLLASQLFGHKRGAFTGAIADHEGVFEAASGGTLFLDEIGDIPPLVQTSLLRVLQERELVRLGESRPRKVDVRILVATHRDLQSEVAKGNFRADLLYRIRVARVYLPPLRQRLQDLPLLISTFLNDFCVAIGKSVEAVSQKAMRRLYAYPWPGNVRELRSAVEFAVIRCRGPVIHPEDLPAEICAVEEFRPSLPVMPADEKQRLLAALEQTGGNRSAAARLLGISRATFYRRLADFGISRNA